MDYQKIKIVKEFPRPTFPTNTMNILGFVSYYRKSVEGFLSIDSPFTILTQKMVMFYWSDDCKIIFVKLKAKLTTTFILTLPEGSNGYEIYCYASRVYLGCVLIHQVHVITYAST